MNRVLTTVLAVALLLGLGALAVLALPGASAPLAAAPFVSAAAPDAPMATNTFNVIALPLHSDAQFDYKASSLLNYIGSSVQQVLTWDAANQLYVFLYPDGFGDDFDLRTGGVYWLEVDKDAPPVASFVGDVPDPGTINFGLVGGPTCMWNEISIPLDQGSITLASELITAIGDVDQVVSWDAAAGIYTFLYADGFGDDFDVRIGYPYGVCMLANKTWPPAN